MEFNKLQVLLLLMHILLTLTFIFQFYILIIPIFRNKLNSKYNPKYTSLLKIQFTVENLPKGKNDTDIKININDYASVDSLSENNNKNSYEEIQIHDNSNTNTNNDEMLKETDSSNNFEGYVFFHSDFFKGEISNKNLKLKLNEKINDFNNTQLASPSAWITNTNYNEKYDLDKEQVLQKMKDSGVERCFIFSKNALKYGNTILYKLHKKFSSDMWFFLLFLLVTILVIFMMISVSHLFIYSYLTTITPDSKPFFSFYYNYTYHVYFFSVNIILPGLFSHSFIYEYNNCLGFAELTKYSIIFQRKFTSLNQRNKIANVLFYEKTVTDNDMNKDFPVNFLTPLSDFTSSSLDYIYVIMFFCFFLWGTSSLRVFKSENYPNLPFVIFSIAGWIATLVLVSPTIINTFIINFSLIGYYPANFFEPKILFVCLILIIFIIIEVAILIISLINLKEENKIKSTLKKIEEENDSLHLKREQQIVVSNAL